MPAQRFTAQLERVLRAALRAAGVEQAFGKLSFTHRREHVEWVESAKRPDTRARRIAATVERVRPQSA